MRNDKLMTLEEARNSCSQFGGQLPSVHSKEDISALGQYTGQFVWLGAKPENKSFSSKPLRAFEWADGSPFDYHVWKYSTPCTDSCCGVAITPLTARVTG